MSFVKTTNKGFILDGKPFYPVGASTYGYFGSNAAVLNRIEAALDGKFTMLRYIDFLSPNAAEGTEYNETVWAIIDYGLHRARQAGIKILLDLSDIRGVFRLRPEFSSYTSQEHINEWKVFTDWLLERENTYNGIKYKDDDTIGIIAITGEVDSTDPLLGWAFNEIAGNIKIKDSNHIVHAGGQKPEQIVDASFGFQNIVPQDILSFPNIDCASTHPYYTLQNMRDLFPKIQEYAVSKGKPWFIEEFGYTGHRDIGKRSKAHQVFSLGHKYGSAGGLMWNFDNGGADGFGYAGYQISKENTPQLYRFLQSMGISNGYTPRLVVT